MLYRSSTNHYDIVYPKDKVVLAGFCQALVYDILYSKVFKMENVNDVVDSMLHENASNFRQDSVNSEGQELDILRIVQEVTSKTSHITLDTSIETSTPEKGLIPPFPYRVAKALDPTIYRNSDYDTWIALKREARFGPYDPNGLQIGAKVIIKTNQLTKSPKGESPAEAPARGGKVKKKNVNAAAYSLPDPILPKNVNKRI
ncbi:putative bifunctional UDP-N-acetylglucosamine transferase and deubiquitinase ALG13, partial [Armadillidium nasatum]